MWVPIALSRDVPGGTTRAVILDGLELALWRGEKGGVQIWEDRCPHRGMRLSFGFVRGDALNCLYHGWEYGSDASCTRIPAHPDLAVPSTIRARAYEGSETGGMIVVNLGRSEPPPVLLSALPVASLAVDSDIETVLRLCRGTPIEGLQAFETEFDGVPLVIGWHRARAGHIMLHAVARAGGTESGAIVALHHLRSAAEQRNAA